MTRRSEFLKANGGTRVPMPGFVLLVRPRGDDVRDAGYGITATRKLGGAVIRNRAKRRLRAIIREQFPTHALAGADHVLIARESALTQGHASLTADVVKALAKAQRRMGGDQAPLPLAGGVGGGPVTEGRRDFAPTPNPSRKREGDGRGLPPRKREGDDKGHQSSHPEASAPVPLHHAAHGPPPRSGEELP